MTEEQPVDEASEVAWWMRWLATFAGVIGGISATVGGFFTVVFNILTPTAIFGGIVQIGLGFLIFVLEATFVCRTVSFAQPVITRMDKIRFWHRGALYCGLSMIAFICLAKVKPLGAIASLITPFATGVLYGLMSLGRKADREQMLQSARAENYTQFENEEP